MKKRKIPKTIPNPDYLASDEFKYRVEQFKQGLHIRNECVEDYFPADFDKDLPKEGGWIMLLMAIHVGKMVGDTVQKIHVPHLSIWYATPTTTQHARKIDGVNLAMTQAIIRHPLGDVHVWPHEYKKTDIAKFLEFGDENGFHIRFLNPETSGFDENKMFYLCSRGFSKPDAQRMLLPELNNPNFCYFEFDPQIAGAFTEGTGTPYLTMMNHSRRAANKAARIH